MTGGDNTKKIRPCGVHRAVPFMRVPLTLGFAVMGLLVFILSSNVLAADEKVDTLTVAALSGDQGFPSPYGHYSRGPGYVRMSLIFDTLVWKDEKGRVLVEYRIIDALDHGLPVPVRRGTAGRQPYMLEGANSAPKQFYQTFIRPA